jgi:hypothetical protein
VRAGRHVKAGLGAGKKKGDSGRERGGVMVGVGTGGKRERGKCGGGGPGGGVGAWVVIWTKASTAALSRMRDRPSANRIEVRRGTRSRMWNGAELRVCQLWSLTLCCCVGRRASEATKDATSMDKSGEGAGAGAGSTSGSERVGG